MFPKIEETLSWRLESLVFCPLLLLGGRLLEKKLEEKTMLNALDRAFGGHICIVRLNVLYLHWSLRTAYEELEQELLCNPMVGELSIFLAMSRFSASRHGI